MTDTRERTNDDQPTVAERADLLADDEPIDRTSMNSPEGIEFVFAVQAGVTRRRND